MTAPAHVDVCRGCGKPTAFLTATHNCADTRPLTLVDEYVIKAQRLLVQHDGDINATAAAFLKSTLPKDHARLLEAILPTWIEAVTTRPQTVPAASRRGAQGVGENRTRKPVERSRKWAAVSRTILDRHVIVSGERLRIGELTAADCRWLATDHHSKATHHQTEAAKWGRLADTVTLAGVDRLADLGADRVKDILG